MYKAPYLCRFRGRGPIAWTSITIYLFLVAREAMATFNLKSAVCERSDKWCCEEERSYHGIAKPGGTLLSQSYERTDSNFHGNFKVILFWTLFFGTVDFEFGIGHAPFVENNCPRSDCIITADRTLYERADAVIFHMRNVDSNTHFPAKRLDFQNYVFFLQEHPYHQWNDLSKFEGIFNLTMTYRKDSDVRIPYGRVIRREQPLQGVNSHLEPLRQLVREKNKLVAWFVSNCNSYSGREKYVRELRKYIDVDIYGKCGDLKCPESSTFHDARMDQECYRMLNTTYKFYISFENNICQDYVTEKLYNALQLYVVPIVYGGVNYSEEAPPKSVINIHDFASPKELAEYLRSLDENVANYLEYFQWKADYDIVSRDAYRYGFCDLCELLHERSRGRQVYDNLDEWWGKKSRCDLNAMKKLGIL